MSQESQKTGTNRRSFIAGAAAGLTTLQIMMPTRQVFGQSFPERPITVVVMYAAGGGTDTIMRKLAEEMAAAKGWTINVINKPGAVGGVATQFVNAARSDGYTVLGGANYNRFVRVLGHADFVPWQEWIPFKAGNALASWSVRADSPFQTFDDAIAAAKAEPGSVSISTSGTGGVWHELALIVANLAGIELKYVPYKGGKPATLAGLQGETDIAGGGVHEHVDLVRAGKLRNLCNRPAPEDHRRAGMIGKVLPSDRVTVLPDSLKAIPCRLAARTISLSSVTSPMPRSCKETQSRGIPGRGAVKRPSQDIVEEEVLPERRQASVRTADRRSRALLETVTVEHLQ